MEHILKDQAIDLDIISSNKAFFTRSHRDSKQEHKDARDKKEEKQRKLKSISRNSRSALYVSIVERINTSTSRKTILCNKDKSHMTNHSKQWCQLDHVIHNNSLALDHFHVTLDQQIAFLIALDTVTNYHFSTNVEEQMY